MPTGLQVFDPATGALVSDFTTRLSQTVGTLTLGDGHGAGSITNAYFAEGTPFATVLGEGRWRADGTPRTPTRISFSGAVLNYTAGDSCQIVYGIY